MPNLQQLCVAYSDLSDMDSYEVEEGGFATLKILDCSHCHISSWDSQIRRQFGRFPSLEQLSLDDNPIKCIPPLDRNNNNEPEPSCIFPSLRSLQIAGTLIASWRDLEGLNSLPLIHSLRLKKTPLTETMGQGEVRALTIARFPSLHYLNGSAVSLPERTEAERRYVSLVSRLLAAQHEQQQQQQQTVPCEKATTTVGGPAVLDLAQDHAQYERLREQYKDMVISSSASASAGGCSLAAAVINVTIKSMEASSCSMDPLVRRLPGSLTVGRLKALCARAFGLDVDLMSLHFRTEVGTFMFWMQPKRHTYTHGWTTPWNE